MVTPSSKPTRREQVARRVYVDLLPPRGKDRASRFGVGVALFTVLTLASLVVTLLGSPELVPSLFGITALAWVLYAFFDFIGGV